jgi:drug/metabolite transporter (DMT)-like permease
VFAVSLAAASALIWGAADFCGGKASRRSPALAVTVLSQILGLPILVASLALVPGELAGLDIAWGTVAGMAGLVGIALLYRGLAGGAMAVVAPITAVTAAVVPLLVGLMLDRAPDAAALAGAALAVVSIGLISLGPRSSGGPRRVSSRMVGLALAAGAMFGVFFSLLAQTHEGSGMWPLAGARAASIGLGLILVARSRLSLRLPRGGAVWAALAGAGDTGANALYLLATREGLLAVVAPIAALYPVSTVLLAFAVDQERVRPIQLAGLGLAATALVLAAM